MTISTGGTGRLSRLTPVAVTTLLLLSGCAGFVPSAAEGKPPEFQEHDTGCAIITEEQVTEAVGDGESWRFVVPQPDGWDEQGRISDPVDGATAQYHCVFETVDYDFINVVRIEGIAEQFDYWVKRNGELSEDFGDTVPGIGLRAKGWEPGTAMVYGLIAECADHALIFLDITAPLEVNVRLARLLCRESGS